MKMKKCKIITVHDGQPETIHNGNFLYVCEFNKAEEVIDDYLDQGYEVKSIVPEYNPAIQEDGVYSFYKGGFSVYLEKEE